MITINIKCNSVEEMKDLRGRMHEALVGSTAYKESEIAICDLQDDAFTLIVGNSNENNVEYDLHSSQLLVREDAKEIKVF